MRSLTRREMLDRSTIGFGRIALAGILAEQAAAAASVRRQLDRPFSDN